METRSMQFCLAGEERTVKRIPISLSFPYNNSINYLSNNGGERMIDKTFGEKIMRVC